MAQGYSGLKASDVLGGVSQGGSGQTIPGSLWSTNQLEQVDSTIARLFQPGGISTSEINQAVNTLKDGIHHPTYQGDVKTLITDIFTGSEIEGKANVVAQLLPVDADGHNNVDLIAKLARIEDIATRLGTEGIHNLIKVAALPSPQMQTRALCTMAVNTCTNGGLQQNGSVPPERNLEPPTGSSQIAMAASTEDAHEVTKLILQSDMDTNELKQLSQWLADRYGPDIKPMFQDLAMNSKDAAVRQFGFNGLMRLAEIQEGSSQAVVMSSNGQTGLTQGLQKDNGEFNISSLKAILSQPEIMPNSLAARVGFSPEINAVLIQIILGE